MDFSVTDLSPYANEDDIMTTPTKENSLFRVSNSPLVPIPSDVKDYLPTLFPLI